MSEPTVTARKKENGAIWNKDGQYGPYMSGKIEIEGKIHNFRVYPNSYKSAPNQADYKIFLIEPKQEETKAPTRAAPQLADIQESDVPF